MLKVHSLTVSPFMSNCHIVQNEESRELVVVDPGDDAGLIIQKLESLGGEVVAIWNTHGHIDHINGNAGVQAAFPAPIHIHESEKEWLESEHLCGASLFGLPFHPSKAEVLWKGGEQFHTLGREWKIYHTPGHSPGCCVILCEEENLFLGGDLLFKGSIGRMDLPGGNPRQMTESLRGVFNDWGRDEWKVFCGHGPATTIGNERRSNFLVHEALAHGFDE